MDRLRMPICTVMKDKEMAIIFQLKLLVKVTTFSDFPIVLVNKNRPGTLD